MLSNIKYKCLVLFILAQTPEAKSQIYSAPQNISGIINIYTKVIAIGGSCSLTVASTAGFSAGHKVLLIQMQGASMNTVNTVSFGDVTSINQTGNYEFGIIQSVSGSDIIFTKQFARTYNTVNGSVQLVTVPQYNGGATVTATLTAQDWNGTTGGVLVYEATTIVMNASMDVSAKGFRKGDEPGGNSWCEKTNYRSTLPQGNYDTTYSLGTVYVTCAEVSASDNPAAWSSVCSASWRSAGNTGCGCNIVVPKCFNAIVNDPLTYAAGTNLTCSGYTSFSTSVIGSGEKGEGIIAMQDWFRGGRGKITNGGGGGNEHNGGGGGGSNYGSGGMGGKGRFVACGALATAQGLGGINLSGFYSNALNKVFMGGGGGSGQGNDGQHVIGADGGGIIIITATSISNSGFKIIANGEDNLYTPATNPGGGYDGTGGGGGGGAVLLKVVNFLSPVTVEAKGGKGGDNLYSGFSDDCYAPGGGGGGGVVWFLQALTPPNVTATVIGGAGGVQAIASARPCYTSEPNFGATSGTNGGLLFNLVLPAGTNNCSLPVELLSFSVRLNNGKAILQWQTASEINNDYFQIERSLDGITWESIARVDGKGNSNSLSDYYFADAEIPFGVIYYRLRQVDHDGSYHLSPVRSISNLNSNSGILNVFPNPISKEQTLHVLYHSVSENSVKFIFQNVLGQIVLEKSVELKEGINSIEMPLTRISQGTYILWVDPLGENDPKTIIVY